MPKAKINGVEIYYEMHGDGDPLVFVHHGLGCTKMWEKVLTSFIKRYKVILYDRRGFGQSEKGENFIDYYINEQYNHESVKELSALLEYLDINDRINIVGQCEGGSVGFHFGAHYPDRVKAIAISSTLCYSKIDMPGFCKGKMFSCVEDAQSDFQDKLFDWHGRDYAPELYSLFMQMGGAYGTGIFDLRETLNNIECPALVLYPDRSRLFDVDQAVLMYKSLSLGELAVLPNCGHNTYEEQPEEYSKIVLSFFERHRTI